MQHASVAIAAFLSVSFLLVLVALNTSQTVSNVTIVEVDNWFLSEMRDSDKVVSALTKGVATGRQRKMNKIDVPEASGPGKNSEESRENGEKDDNGTLVKGSIDDAHDPAPEANGNDVVSSQDDLENLPSSEKPKEDPAFYNPYNSSLPTAGEIAKRWSHLPKPPTCFFNYNGSTVLSNSTLPLSANSNSTTALNNLTLPTGTIRRLYFVHMRKAGGSSIRTYFREVAEKYGWKYRAVEGHKSPELPGTDPHTLYITHMREPIGRSLSHYKYEQRWGDCKPLVSLLKVRNATQEDTVMSLYNFTTKEWWGRTFLWTCAANCHARWATGMHKHEEMLAKHDVLEQKAFETFWKYNLVVVTDWLKRPEYVAALELLFGHSNLNRQRGMHCGPSTWKANKQVPLKVSPPELEALHHFNRIDSAIYQKLTQCDFDVDPNHLQEYKDTWQKNRDIMMTLNNITITPKKKQSSK